MSLRCVLALAMAKAVMAAAEFTGADRQFCGGTDFLRESGLWHDGRHRSYLFYSPKPNAEEPLMPLLLLAPGTDMDPRRAFEITGFQEQANSKRFAVAVLIGEGNNLNVELHGQAHAPGPDDVSYTEAVAKEAAHRMCADVSRVFCTGYSRGARFCSRLASELSGIVRAIAPIAGARFPAPNNATRPMPILAFHGKKDPINPYFGNGNPAYWHTSVPVAIESWANFNKCKCREQHGLANGVVMDSHTNCQDGADVILITIDGGGHTWPGTTTWMDPHVFGVTTHEISATDLLWDFFLRHGSLAPAEAKAADATALVGEPSPGQMWIPVLGCQAITPLMLGGGIVAGCAIMLLIAMAAGLAIRHIARHRASRDLETEEVQSSRLLDA